MDFDLLTIGAGSGGVRASRMSAARGANVAVAECGPLGGTCVNAGCVPKKLLVYAARFGEAFEDARGFGWTSSEPSFDWRALIAAKDRELRRLNGIYERILGDAGVTILPGRARLVDDHTVEIDGRRYSAEHILVASGGRPSIPSLPGAELGISSNEGLALEDFPDRIVIVGGGYIAVEFAGVFNALGAEVTLLYRGPLFLRGFDDDVRNALADEMSKKGIVMRWSTEVAAIEREGSGLRVKTSEGDTIDADQVLFATGRLPNTASLGLEDAGVELGKRGEVLVDKAFRTSVPHIFAIGDCTDRVLLTPVALAEGMAVAETLFGSKHTTVDYDTIPTAVFSQPEVATVGLTEDEARQRYDTVGVYRSSFKPMVHTLSGREERTMVKLLVEGGSDRVIGAHMVGHDAGEIIQGVAIAMKAGATKADFDRTIGIHPTAAEEFVSMRTRVDS